MCVPAVPGQPTLARVPTPKDQMTAVSFLRETGWGKPLQQVELTTLDGGDKTASPYACLSDDDMRAIDAVLARAQARIDK